jgi:hypothetical protein
MSSRCHNNAATTRNGNIDAPRIDEEGNEMIRIFATAAAVMLLAMTAHADPVPREIIGTWCLSSEYDGKAYYLEAEAGSDCNGNGGNVLVIKSDRYNGHEFSCRFTEVKAWTDRDEPLNTKQMTAPTVRIEALCGIGNDQWREMVVLALSKGMLIARNGDN